jgi:hypothetical protein
MTSQKQSVSASLPSVIINVDLLVSASHFLDRLSDVWRQFVDLAAESTNDAEADRRLRQSIYRYERLWLPLWAEWRSNSSGPSTPPSILPPAEIEPPADIGWVWHLHQLRPKHYADFCQQRYGRVLPHRTRPARGQDINRAAELTATMWRERYPGVPFDTPTAADAGNANAAPDPRLAELIIGVARLEVDFVYQVALPHFRDQNFLYTSVERYRKWLLLRQHRPDDARHLQLPIDIQLIACAHALHPLEYATDMNRLFPASSAALLNPMFDDNASDLIHQPNVTESSNAIWRSFYRTEKLFIAGTGCRGRLAVVGNLSNPLVAFHGDHQLSSSRRALESCDISFKAVAVEELWSRSKRVVVEAQLLGENSLPVGNIFRISGAVGATLTGDPSPSPLGVTHFDALRNRGIELVVYGRRGFACLARNRKVATKQFNPLQMVTAGPVAGTIMVTNAALPKVTYTDPKITISFDIQV